MAINKNFVVKNGLEVNTSLIVADSDNSRVGVATTTPTYQFHVFGGIGVTNLTVTGLSTFSGISTFQDGVFITGISTHIGVGTFQDNVFIDGNLNVAGSANLFTDTTDNTLGDVNTGSVQLDGGAGIALNLSVGAGLSVGGNVHVSGASTFSDRVIVGSAVTIDNGLDVTGVVTATGYTVNRTQVISSGRELQNIASLDATTTATIEAAIVSGPNTFDDLKVSGISTFIGLSTFAAGVGIADSVFHLSDNTTSFRFPSDGTFTVEATGTERLRVNENGVNIVGLVTASSGGKFNQIDVGKSNINGITGDANITLDAGGGTGGAVIIASDVGLQALSNLNVAGITTQTGDLIVGVSTLFADVSTGRVGIGTDVPATTLDVAGDLTADSAKVEDLTSGRVVLAGTDGELEDSANLTFDGTGLVVTGNVNVSGALTASSAIVGSAVTINDTGINVTGVATVNSVEITGGSSIGLDVVTRNINASGVSTFVGFSTFNDSVFVQDNLSVGGITTSNSYTVDGTTVITSGRELQNIASLDATTTATIESAIANAPNTFTDLKVTGITTLGIASATDFTADNVNVSLATTTNILAVTGIATAETLQVGNLGLSVTGITTIEVSSASTALRVTQTGAGDALLIEDQTSPDGSPFVVTGIGSVGIGIANPARLLSVMDSTGPVLELGTNNTNANPSLFLHEGLTGSTTNGGGLIYNADNNRLDIVVGATIDTPRISILRSDGKVGIATTTPQTALHLLNADPVIRLQDDNAANNIFAEIDANSTVGSLFLDLDKNNAGADTQFGVSLDGSGKLRLKDVGLGVLNTSPTSALDVTGDARISGVVTAIGGYNLGIHSAGTEVTTATGIITALDFVGSGNSICFKNQSATSKVIEINIAGSGGGGGGGVTETDTNVSSTSATGVGSFAVASFRSAAVIAQIDQTGDYQVGRYLMIHDGTTVTVVEESAVSTGATMLGSFSGAIVGSNAELQVTMGNAGIATVTTKIDTVTV